MDFVGYCERHGVATVTTQAGSAPVPDRIVFDKLIQVELRGRADRALIEQAAAQLRRGAIRAGYARTPDKHYAFGLALVLDELARHLRDPRPEVRAQVVAGARMLLR